jgi:hypothetical protein
MANTSQEKVYRLKGSILDSLETRIFTKKYFFLYGSFSIKDGPEIHFWEDKWLSKATLRKQYPALYNIVYHKSDIIAKVLETFPPNVTFRRNLIGARQISWHELLQSLELVQLTV